MAVYTVHEPPNAPASRLAKAESLVFIKDGFAWGAFLVAPLWFIFKGEWRGLIGYLVLVALLAAIVDADANAATLQALTFGLNLVVGFEANNILRWSRSRRGWREIATVSGSSRDDCERRFFDAWLAGSDDALPAGGAPTAAEPIAGRAKRALDALSERLRQRFAPKT